MAVTDTKVIGAYTAAITIDGATHFLLIQPGNSSTAYKKISRNVLLGISSAPLGTTDTQSPTNKTFDNTNAFTIKDTNFTLQDDGDTTKQAKFQLSGITTATTRTYTLPNASSTLADIATVQTFTNKTLTSPVISGGTIDNSTITVDSIAGHTTPNSGTVYGLAVTSSKISGTSITNGSITFAQVTTGFAVQIVSTVSGAVATGTTTIPNDDTIPQSSEGDQYMSLAITPLATSNKLVIEVVAFVSNSAAVGVIGALFQDATANAIATGDVRNTAAGEENMLIIKNIMTAGTTSATTFKVRIGGDGAGTTTFNGTGGARRFGGITLSSITITEYKA